MSTGGVLCVGRVNQRMVTFLANLATILRITVSSQMIITEAVETKAFGVEQIHLLGDRQFLEFEAPYQRMTLVASIAFHRRTFNGCMGGNFHREWLFGERGMWLHWG